MSNISFIFKIDDNPILKYGKIIGLNFNQTLELDKEVKKYVLSALNDYYKKKYSYGLRKLFIGIIGESTQSFSVDEADIFNLYIIIKDDKINFTYSE